MCACYYIQRRLEDEIKNKINEVVYHDIQKPFIFRFSLTLPICKLMLLMMTTKSQMTPVQPTNHKAWMLGHSPITCMLTGTLSLLLTLMMSTLNR